MSNSDSSNTGAESSDLDHVDQSDSALMRGIEAGDDESAKELFQRYAGRLQSLANRQMAREISGRIDAEDVTQSIFRTLFRRLQAGQYSVPQGDSIWRLMVTIALNKIRGVGAYHRAAKRDIRRSANLDDQAKIHAADDEVAANLLRMTIDEILGKLSESQQRIIHFRLEGQTVTEIAASTGRSKRTVERTLQGFRQQLTDVLAEDERS